MSSILITTLHLTSQEATTSILSLLGRHQDRGAGFLEGARGEADVVQVEVRAVKGPAVTHSARMPSTSP